MSGEKRKASRSSWPYIIGVDFCLYLTIKPYTVKTKLFSPALVVFSTCIVAQSTSISGGAGHFFIGQSWINYDNLNRMFVDPLYNYATNLSPVPPTEEPENTFQSPTMMVGGGGFGVINNFLIGGEGGVLLPSELSNRTYHPNASLASGYGLLKFGYMFPLNDKMVLYPTVGMGYGGSILTQDFFGVEEREFTSEQVFLQAELNFDLFPFSDLSGLKTGLSVGYMFNPYSTPWTNEEGGFSRTVPAHLLNGFYFRLTTGGGGYSIKRES